MHWRVAEVWSGPLNPIKTLICLPRMCVAWHPIYRIPDAPLNAKFLTYHSLAPAPSATTHYGAACPPAGGSPPLAGARSGLPGTSSAGGSPLAAPQHQQLCLPLVGLKASCAASCHSRSR